MSKGVVTESFDGWAVPPGTLTDLVFAEDGGVRHPVLDTEAARGLLVALRAAREDALLRDTVQERVRLLGRAGARFLDPEDPLRQEAEERLPATADISPEMARAVIEGMARDWTAERLAALRSAELSNPRPSSGSSHNLGGGGHAPSRRHCPFTLVQAPSRASPRPRC